MTNHRLKKNLQNYYVVLGRIYKLVTGILFASDWALSRPIYTPILDFQILGDILAGGMAVIMGTLPQVTAKLFVKKSYGLATTAIAFGIWLLSFIYVAQKEVAIKNALTPLEVAMNGGAPSSNVSEVQTHIFATALVALLYGIATFLGYLYYSDENKFKSTGFLLSMSQLSREYSHNLLILGGKVQRAFARITKTAEAKVNVRIHNLRTDIKKLSHQRAMLESQRDYDLLLLKNAEERVLAAIKSAYKSQTVQY